MGLNQITLWQQDTIQAVLAEIGQILDFARDGIAQIGFDGVDRQLFGPDGLR